MRGELKELWRFRELLLAMVERELRIRYKNSVLGFFWSLLIPLVTVAVMTVVFKVFLKNETPNFGAYVLAAYLPFLFINQAILDSAQSVLVSLPIVKKVYFPREILPLASVISNFIHLILSLFVFLGYLFVVYASSGFVDSPFTWRLSCLPIVLVMTLMFSAGSAFLISSLNVFYEDVKYIVSVLLYLMFFITPVMYFSEQVQAGLKGPNAELLFNLYHLNPVAMIITVFRRMLLPPTQVSVGQDEVLQPMAFMWGHAGVAFGVCFAMLVFGYWVFNRMKWRFVERP